MDNNFARLSAEDMAEVAELESQCFSSPWTEKQLQAALDLPHFIVYGLRRQGQLLAYVSLGVVPGEMEVLNLATRPEYRRQGLGKQILIQALAETAKVNGDAGGEGIAQVALEVREGNTPARGLYHSLGFVEVGRRKHYYQDNGEDALVMTLMC